MAALVASMLAMTSVGKTAGGLRSNSFRAWRSAEGSLRAAHTTGPNCQPPRSACADAAVEQAATPAKDIAANTARESRPLPHAETASYAPLKLVMVSPSALELGITPDALYERLLICR